MAHIAADLISNARAQFAGAAHSTLRGSHGHHFEVHAPKQAPVRHAPPRTPLAQMMEPMQAAVDPEVLMAQKQRKIAAHNARINSINNAPPPQAASEAASDTDEDAA